MKIESSITKTLQDWTKLLLSYSQAEQSSQSRLTIANTLGRLAVTVLVDSKQLLGEFVRK